MSRLLSCVVACCLLACRPDGEESGPGGGRDGGGAGAGGAAGGSGATASGGAASGTGGVNPEAGSVPFDDRGCVHPPVAADCDDGFCTLPAGCFVMGSPVDEPGRGLRNEEQTKVTLTHSFAIGQYEVTGADFTEQGLPIPSKVFADGPYAGKGNCLDADCPVGNVTWFEAVAFSNLLSERHDPPLQPCYVLEGCTGDLGAGLVCQSVTLLAPTVYDCEGYRLPTDAEWEYAARAGTRSAFYSGPIEASATSGSCSQSSALDGAAWYCHSAADYTSRPVGQLTPNAWGLYDVLGNLEEWINDPQDGKSSPSETDPRGTLNDSLTHYVRGGSVYAWPTLCRSARQGIGVANLPSPVNGFRLARTLP
jgi:formylglycine-generating enzyme